jgi:hypothetical protein
MSPAVSACAILGIPGETSHLRRTTNRTIHAAASHSASLRTNVAWRSSRRSVSRPQSPPLDNATSLPPAIHGHALSRPVMG